MKLKFPGTRGYIDESSELHNMHTCCEVSYRGKGFTIDCGLDWIDRLDELNPKALVLTHGHPDHVGGLERGVDCPVYATEETWEVIKDYPIGDPHVIKPREPVEIRGVTVEAFTVKHSFHAPAVGLRITAGKVTIFYAPDLVYINDRQGALSGVKAYIGDGATIRKSFVRKSHDQIIGHVPVQTQLTWLKKEGVPLGIVTHCGSEIVRDHDRALDQIRDMARQRGVKAEIAFDNMEKMIK
jgi:phosphoribosyl 1,2-cyclic phosphodiesterase